MEEIFTFPLKPETPVIPSYIYFLLGNGDRIKFDIADMSDSQLAMYSYLYMEGLLKDAEERRKQRKLDKEFDNQ